MPVTTSADFLNEGANHYIHSYRSYNPQDQLDTVDITVDAIPLASLGCDLLQVTWNIPAEAQSTTRQRTSQHLQAVQTIPQSTMWNDKERFQLLYDLDLESPAEYDVLQITPQAP